MNLVQILIEARDQASKQIRDVQANLAALKSEADASGKTMTAAAAASEAAMVEMTVAAAALTFGMTLTVTILGAVAVAATMGAKQLAGMAAEIEKIRQVTGLGTDTIRGLQLRFEELNLSAAAIPIGLDKFQKAIVEGDTALLAMGVTSKDTMTALMQAANSFAGMAEGPNKAAFAQRLFGAAARDWLPVMNQGSEVLSTAATHAESLGLGIERSKDRLIDFNAKTAETRERVQGFSQDLVLSLLPAIDRFFGMLNDLLRGLRAIPSALDGMRDGMRRFVESLPGGKVLMDLERFVSLMIKVSKLAADGKEKGVILDPTVAKRDPGAPPPEHERKPRAKRERDPKVFGPGNDAGYAEFVRQQFEAADKAARELQQTVDRMTGALAQGFQRAFDGLISGALSLQKALGTIFRATFKLITDEIAKFLASQVVSAFLKLAGKFVVGFATGGVAGGVAAVFAPGMTSAPVGSGGASQVGSSGASQVGSSGASQVGSSGGVTNVYLSTIDERGVGDHYRSASGAFNIYERRRAQAGAL